MLRRIAYLALLLACDCGSCSGCDGGRSGGQPQADAAPAGATASASSAPAAPIPPAGSAPHASTNAAFPTWPPEGAGCAAFAACCDAARPNGAVRTVCMASYNETGECQRALDVFRSRLEALHAPIPDACRAH